MSRWLCSVGVTSVSQWLCSVGVTSVSRWLCSVGVTSVRLCRLRDSRLFSYGQSRSLTLGHDPICSRDHERSDTQWHNSPPAAHQTGRAARPPITPPPSPPRDVSRLAALIRQSQANLTRAFLWRIKHADSISSGAKTNRVATLPAKRERPLKSDPPIGYGATRSIDSISGSWSAKRYNNHTQLVRERRRIVWRRCPQRENVPWSLTRQ